MISIAHISDIHLSPLPPVSIAELFSKRITGYINWKLNRKKHMQANNLLPLIKHLNKQKPDITAITGDLVNLSTDKEFENAANWLKNFGTPKNTCLIAGNHDAYLSNSLKKFQSAMGQYIKGETLDNADFPFIRSIKNVAIINTNSAVPTAPFMAYGKFDEAQALRLATMLKKTKQLGFFRIITIHHPPFKAEANKFKKGLRGANLFRDVIEQYGAELILHGHTHRSTINAIKGPSDGIGGNEVPVIGVASASAHALSKGDPARYNLFSIEKIGTRFSCSMQEYGYQRIGDEIALRLKMRIY